MVLDNTKPLTEFGFRPRCDEDGEAIVTPAGAGAEAKLEFSALLISCEASVPEPSPLPQPVEACLGADGLTLRGRGWSLPLALGPPSRAEAPLAWDDGLCLVRVVGGWPARVLELAVDAEEALPFAQLVNGIALRVSRSLHAAAPALKGLEPSAEGPLGWDLQRLPQREHLGRFLCAGYVLHSKVRLSMKPEPGAAPLRCALRFAMMFAPRRDMQDAGVRFRFYAHGHARAPDVGEIALGGKDSAELQGHVIAVNLKPDLPRGGAMCPTEVPRTTFLTFRFVREAQAWWDLAVAAEAEAHLLGRLSRSLLRPQAYEAAGLGPDAVAEMAREELRSVAKEVRARPQEPPASALAADDEDLDYPAQELPEDYYSLKIRRAAELESAQMGRLLEETRNNPRVIPEASGTCIVLP